jgi:hypothetical protein
VNYRRFRCNGRGGIAGFAVLALVTGLAVARADAAVTFGQLDTFQDGTTMGWVQGVASPAQPVNVPTGGPGGEGDRFLQNVSTGEFGPGGKQIVFNQQQWAGDYNAARVTRIDASVANLGAAPLYLRVALSSGSGDRFGSRAAVELPPDGAWRRVSFDLTADALAQIGGANGLASTLSNVVTLRLLSAQGGPSFTGDDVVGTLGVDDIRALRLPGDANFDGRVDSADLLVARRHLGNRAASVTWAEGDFNFDGRVSAADFILLRRNFGTSIPTPALAAAQALASAPLPEPGSASVVALAATAVLLRRRRRPTRSGSR